MAIPIHNQVNPVMQRVTIGPDYAARLLDRNEHNRRFSNTSTVFLQLCRALSNGEWQFNGDAIRLDWNGRLIDGQHRLHAVVATGIPIDTLLVEGLDPKSQETVDTGKARSVSDFLTMRGEKSPTLLAAVAKGRLMAETLGLKMAISRKATQFTVPEQLTYIDDNPDLRRVTVDAQRLTQRIPLPGSMIGTLLVEFEARDKEDSKDFWERLASGAGLEDGHPVLSLRNQLIRLQQDTKGQRNLVYLGALTIKAWNKYRMGETIQNLNYRAGGANPEKFPEVL